MEDIDVVRRREFKYFLTLPLVVDEKLIGMIVLALVDREVLNTQELDFYNVFGLQSSLILQQVMEKD